MNKIEIYTDGSSLGNPGPGGWGVVFISDKKIIQLGGYDKNTTNNKMELKSVIESLKYMEKNFKDYSLIIHADSNYVLNGINSWIFNWEKNGWRTANKKPVLNKELWVELISLVRKFDKRIKWEKVKGHDGVEYNELADEIANESALKQINIHRK